MALVDASGIPYVDALPYETQEEAELIFTNSPDADGVDYAVMVTPQAISWDVYFNMDVGGYAGATVESQATTCNPVGNIGTRPGIGSWFRTGVWEITWKAVGDDMSVDVTDVTRGSSVPFGVYQDDNDRSCWGFMPAGTYLDFYEQVKAGTPREERNLQMLDKIPADNTEEFALWLNGIPWAFTDIAAMPAPGTKMTLTLCFGNWNADMTQFTQHPDAPYPGDRWQIDIQGMAVEEPEPSLPGDVTLSCDSVTAEAGAAGEVLIRLDNANASVAGCQFVITPDPPGLVSFCGVSPSARLDGLQVSSSAAGGGLMVLVYSESGGVLGKGTGEILTLCFEVSEDAGPENVSLVLSQDQVAGETLQPLSAALVNGCILVGGGVPEKKCDFSGDGKILINDVIVFLLRARDNPDDPTVDWNGDGRYMINDAIVLLLDIMKGTCPDAPARLSSASAVGPAAAITGLSSGDIAYLEQTIAQMELTPEQQEALHLALYGVEGPASLPEAFSLSQNSPNPFNPSTAISFGVPESHSGQVSLKVFDLRGRLVKNLVNEARQAGSYSVFWDGTDESGRPVSSGIYLYRMRAGSFVQTRKMVLLK